MDEGEIPSDIEDIIKEIHLLLINRYPLRKLNLNLSSSLMFLQRVATFKLIVEVGHL
jgi:hypothetical protein